MTRTQSGDVLPRLTLITVTYNAATVFDDFWASLVAQEGADWCLVVVDNASTDGTADKLSAIADDARVTIIFSETNTGAAEGNNIGLRLALAQPREYVVLCNNDILFDPTTLRRLVDVKKSLPHGGVTPVLVFEDERSTAWFEMGEISTHLGVRCFHKPANRGHNLEVYSTSYAPTTFLLFDHIVIKTVGELDSAYFAYWEDADYIWRIRSEGFGIWVDPGTTVVHKVSQSSGGHGSMYSNHQYFKNQIRFTRKHFGRAACGYTMMMSVLRIGARAALRLDSRTLTKAKLTGLWAGVVALSRSASSG